MLAVARLLLDGWFDPRLDPRRRDRLFIGLLELTIPLTRLDGLLPFGLLDALLYPLGNQAGLLFGLARALIVPGEFQRRFLGVVRGFVLCFSGCHRGVQILEGGVLIVIREAP